MSLIDTGCTLSVGDGLFARTSTVGTVNVNWTSSRTLRHFVRADVERGRDAVHESRSHGHEGVAPGRHVWEDHLSGAVTQRRREHGACWLLTQLDLRTGQLNGAFERRHGRHDATAAEDSGS